MRTEKLYDIRPYATDFTAKVLTCEPTGDLYGVILDKTLFFPEEGGQACDRGTLGGEDVRRVEICGETIVHYVGQSVAAGTEVDGHIEFLHRYRNMQNHSGEHIVSGLIHKLYGFNNVGFHLGSSDVTMDYDGELTDEMLDRIEDEANAAVYANVEIIAEYPEKSDLANMNYRSKLDLTENVRIVTVPGYDVCACCAPHVARTGEIGIIKFVGHYRYKGGMRIHMHCGTDALLDYREKQRTVSALSALLSVKKHEVCGAVERIFDENDRLSARISSVTKKLCTYIADSIPETGRGTFVFEQDIGAAGMRIIANAAVSKTLFCAVFDGNDKDGYRYIAASEKLSARRISSALADNFGAGGGGSDKMVQGSVKAKSDEIIHVLESIL